MQPEIINRAQQAISRGERSLLDTLPVIINRILEDGLWKECKDQDGQNFKSFRAFAEYKLWWGLECPFERLQRYCEHDKECSALLRKEVGDIADHGANQFSEKGGDNVTSYKIDRGNSGNYITARLKRDSKNNPEAAKLYDQVIAGEIKPHAAAVKMGYKKKADPVAQAQKIIPNLPPPAKLEIWQQLGRDLPDEFDYLAAAKEAAMNLTDEEIDTFKAWVQAEL